MKTSPDVIEAAVPADGDQVLPSATLGGDNKRSIEQIALLLFIVVPFVALVAAVVSAVAIRRRDFVDHQALPSESEEPLTVAV